MSSAVTLITVRGLAGSLAVMLMRELMISDPVFDGSKISLSLALFPFFILSDERSILVIAGVYSLNAADDQRKFSFVGDVEGDADRFVCGDRSKIYFCVSSDISGAFMRCPGVSWLKSSETMVNMDRPTVSASVSGMSEKSAVVIPHSVMRFESSVKASDTCSPGGTVSGATITFR